MANVSVTTTLPYVNSDPHIGFALEIIQADTMARYYRAQGAKVFFNTGTDEHGLKIFRKAEAEGKLPQAYVDEWAPKFDRLKSALNLSYNRFIRTTDPEHIAAAQEFWKRCDAAGDIYRKSYTIKYCVGCELEKTESELVGGVCPLHPHLPLELIDEENYFFRFSKYQHALLDLYRQRSDFVVPEFRLNEIRSFVSRGLEDFSISRLASKMPWGVPVPGDPDHVMYVWFDALVNYLSALGWPDMAYRQWWPSIQFAGKDNLRQQSAMWQAMLLSAGEQPSRQIVIHGFVTADGQKMSKSLGNVVDPVWLAGKFGADAVRYFCLRHMHPFEDSDFTLARFKEAYTADLANGLGNLVSRVTNMLERYVAGEFTDTADDKDVPIRRALESFRFDEALQSVWVDIDHANRAIDEAAPWQMAKEGRTAALKTLLNNLANDLVSVGHRIQPFMPETSDRILQAMKAPVKKCPPLFPRV